MAERSLDRRIELPPMEESPAGTRVCAEVIEGIEWWYVSDGLNWYLFTPTCPACHYPVRPAPRGAYEGFCMECLAFRTAEEIGINKS